MTTKNNPDSQPADILDEIQRAIEKIEGEIDVCEHNNWQDDVKEWKQHIQALTSARDFIASLTPTEGASPSASGLPSSTVAEALEIVDRFLAIFPAKSSGFLQHESMQTIRAALVGQEMRIKELGKNQATHLISAVCYENGDVELTYEENSDSPNRKRIFHKLNDIVLSQILPNVVPPCTYFPVRIKEHQNNEGE